MTSFHFEAPPKTVVKVGDSRPVVVSPEEEPIVVTLPTGLPGPPGPTGPQGEKGDPGQGAGGYVFTQSTPEATWTIDHSLGYLPAVTVVDSSGAVVEGDIVYADDDTLVVTFSAAFSGKAFLS